MTNEEFAAISDQLETVHLTVRQTLYEDGSPVHDVYFPIDCVISVVTTNERRLGDRDATVGYEGMWARKSRSGRKTCSAAGSVRFRAARTR